MTNNTAKKADQLPAKTESKVLPIAKEVNPTESKIQHIISIGQKIKRRSEVAKAKADLESFILTSDHASGNFEFEDVNRKRFTSDDPALMQRIQRTVIAACEEEIELLNNQINSFTC